MGSFRSSYLLFFKKSFHFCFAKDTNSLFLLSEDGGELGSDGVTDLGGLGLAANITSLDALFNDNLDGLVDGLGQSRLLQRVLEHHTDGQNHGDGVDDALA